MPLINIIGDVRTGKTLLMTALAVDTYLAEPGNITVYHNYDLALDKAIKIAPEDLFRIRRDGKQHLVLIDEAYAWLESRVSSHSETNQYLSYILFQSGKDDTTFILTEQLLSTIDKRFRKMSNVIIEAQADPEGFIYTFMLPNLESFAQYYVRREEMEPYYKYYGTFTKIQPIDDDMMIRVVSDKTKLGPEIDAIINELYKISPGGWTKGAIDAWLLKHRYAPAYGRYVYNEIKLREIAKKDKG